jgi:hypothetical protein
MADESNQETQQMDAAKPKKTRTPIRYVVFVLVEGGALAPITEPGGATDQKGRPVLREFEGFRRKDVLDDLIDGKLVEPEEDSGKTPWCQIIPASSVGFVRGTVETKTSVGVEE